MRIQRGMKRTSKKKLIQIALVLLTLIEVAGISVFWKLTEPVSMKGALIKDGARYILRWENSDKTADAKEFASPQEAVDFARNELQLEVGANPNFSDSIENVWVRNEMGKKIVFWKTVGLPFVNRLTFTNLAHADLFESSFRKGAYSTSPVGHSISFIQAGLR